MNRKEKFLTAVQILAPGDQVILKAAENVAEEGLPLASGGTALRFVAAMQRMNGEATSCKSRSRSEKRRSTTPAFSDAHSPLALEHALHIKSAEFWLRIGEPLEALADLENLPESARGNSWVRKIHASAIRAAKEFQAMSMGV